MTREEWVFCLSDLHPYMKGMEDMTQNEVHKLSAVPAEMFAGRADTPEEERSPLKPLSAMLAEMRNRNRLCN